jgi:hypothetical protein
VLLTVFRATSLPKKQTPINKQEAACNKYLLSCCDTIVYAFLAYFFQAKLIEYKETVNNK